MSSEPVDRKLAAILSADVVGYSRLMADDEAATIRTLTSYRESIAMLIRQHRGRVVDSPGDNVLADFPTALDAVRCALEIQGVLRARNVSLATERRMEFRIGVHMGDVATEGGRVYGDGVNIAARLEGLAEAGGICISATVHDQVRNKVDVGYTDLGDQTVKNIPEQVHVYRVQPRATEGVGPQQSEPTLGERRRFPMALVVTAAVLLLVGGALWGTWPRPLGLILDVTGVGRPPVDPALPDKPSVVVLPFENMSGDAEQAYFSDGLTEELTANLAGSPLLFVISRNSAFSYKGRPVRVETIGRELGVRYVVEGSVRKAGERVRITAQLIDATTGHHLWSEQYDRDLSDIFAVQSEISEAILVAVGVQVNEAELARIRRRPTDSLSAYEAYTRAVSLVTMYTRKDLAEARRLLERALEIDPDYAAARSLLGGTYSAEYGIGWSQDPALLDRAEELTERALEIDPTLWNAHLVLATVSLSRRRPERVLFHAEKAIELAPSVAFSRVMLAVGQAQSGRPVAAIESLQSAMRLDPRVEGNDAILTVLAGFYWNTGRTDEAVRMWERAREGNSDLVIPRLSLADYYAAAGEPDKARPLVEELRLVVPEMTAESGAGLVSRARGSDQDQTAALEANLRSLGLP
jgi:adenylate cyclase